MSVDQGSETREGRRGGEVVVGWSSYGGEFGRVWKVVLE